METLDIPHLLAEGVLHKLGLYIQTDAFPRFDHLQDVPNFQPVTAEFTVLVPVKVKYNRSLGENSRCLYQSIMPAYKNDLPKAK